MARSGTERSCNVRSGSGVQGSEQERGAGTMGRSFLSIKLAAVFGLMVAAAVSVQQRAVAESGIEESAVESGVVVVVRRADAECDAAARARSHTVRARVHAARAAAAARS